MRSCKKEEVKIEKTPLFMCSFCKMTFKTRPQISQHFLKCYHSPYRKTSTAKVCHTCHVFTFVALCY